LVARAFEILPEPERARLLAARPRIDLDPTDVEVYGKKKRGVAFNYAGQRCGRPLSPTGTVRAEIHGLFAGDGDLLGTLEQVARLSVRLTFQRGSSRRSSVRSSAVTATSGAARTVRPAHATAGKSRAR